MPITQERAGDLAGGGAFIHGQLMRDAGEQQEAATSGHGRPRRHAAGGRRPQPTRLSVWLWPVVTRAGATRKRQRAPGKQALTAGAGTRRQAGGAVVSWG